VAIALDNPATQYANRTAATPAGAVRMLNEALREKESEENWAHELEMEQENQERDAEIEAEIGRARE